MWGLSHPTPSRHHTSAAVVVPLPPLPLCIWLLFSSESNGGAGNSGLAWGFIPSASLLCGGGGRLDGRRGGNDQRTKVNSRAPSLSILSPPSLCNDGGPGAEYADYKSTAPTARTAARACRPPPPMVNLHPSAPRRAELGFRRRLRRRRPLVRPRLGVPPSPRVSGLPRDPVWLL